MITIGGKTIYHAGDTCLFGDMELIARRHPVDVAILPIGGHYTMDRHDAAFAAGLIGAATVIPCHYDTFPPIEADAEAFKADVEDQSSSEVVILAPGEDARAVSRVCRSSRRLVLLRSEEDKLRPHFEDDRPMREKVWIRRPFWPYPPNPGRLSSKPRKARVETSVPLVSSCDT